MTKQYRVVRDSFAGYEVQGRYWIFPWMELNSNGSELGTNTSSCLEEAQALGNRWLAQKKVVFVSERRPI